MQQKLTRMRLEQLMSDLLEQLDEETAVKLALERTTPKMSPYSGHSEVVLVGGSTAYSKVQQLVSTFLAGIRGCT